MIALLMILVKQSLAYEMETEDDGKSYGFYTLYAYIAIWGAMLLLIAIKQSHIGLYGSFTQSITFLQFARWVPLLNFSTTSYYKEFWISINYFFEGYRYTWTTYRPEQPNFEKNRIETTLFIENAQQYFLLLIVCVLLFIFIPNFRADYWRTKPQFSILSWVFLVSCLDLTLYGFIQLNQISDSGAVMIISVVLALMGIVWICLTGFFILTSIIKGKIDHPFLSYFVKEFKQKHAFFLLYYPFFIISRIAFSLLLTFAYNHPYLQFIIMISIECFLILYLLLCLPYSVIRNSVFTIIYHVYESALLILVTLYDHSYGSDFILNNISSWICWSGILITLIRFISDFIWTIPSKMVVQDAKIEEEIQNSNKNDISINASVEETTINANHNKENKEIFVKRNRDDRGSISSLLQDQKPPPGTHDTIRTQSHAQSPSIIVSDLESECISSTKPMKNLISPVYSERTDYLRLKIPDPRVFSTGSQRTNINAMTVKNTISY